MKVAPTLVALVPGGSGRIGRVVSERLARDGLAVHYAGNEARVDEVVEGVASAGGRAMTVTNAAERIAGEAIDAFGLPVFLVRVAHYPPGPHPTAARRTCRVDELVHRALARRLTRSSIPVYWGRSIPPGSSQEDREGGGRSPARTRRRTVREDDRKKKGATAREHQDAREDERRGLEGERDGGECRPTPEEAKAVAEAVAEVGGAGGL